MKKLSKAHLAVGLAATLGVAAAPAHAEWNRGGWHHEGWDHHAAAANHYYRGHPGYESGVVYAPPVVYSPPPPPSPGIDLIFPVHIH